MFAVKVGNVALYKALSDTYQRCTKTVNDEEYADLLWAAVKSGLHSSMKGSKPTVLIVDGTDESTCGQDVLLKGLRGASADVDNLKLIVTGSEKHDVFPKQSTVNITPDLISDDIAAVVRTVFHHCPSYNSLGAEDQEVCVHRIVKAAEGSFLWAKLASKRIRDENTSKTRPLVKDIGTFVKANHSVSDFANQTLKSNASQAGVKIVAWLATAARPLTISELSSLLSIQPDKGAIVEQKVEPLNLLKPFASLVFYQNNMVYLRHGQLRSAICHAISNDKSIPAIKDTQLDLIRRMSVYIKNTVTGKEEPSLDTPDPQQAQSLLEKHTLLDFSLRYWLGHTRIAFGCNTDQEISKAGQALSQVFPTSPNVPMLEMTVWRRKPTPSLLSLHTTQARLYQQVLGTRDPATLQAILCQALFFQTVQDVQSAQASEVFYNAAKICQSILTVHHLITMRMTKHFIDFTQKTTTSNSEIMTKRTEMLQILVECYRVHYGSSSEMVVSTLSQLSEHYHAIGQTHKAQEITTLIQGYTGESQQETTTTRRPSEQSLVVQLHGKKDTVEHGTVLTLDETFQDDIAITTTFNLESLLAKAEKLIREGSLTAAERIFVDIWQQTSKDYRVHHSTESELRIIKAITAYSDFLKSQKRDIEVASVLSSFWEEHGQSMSSSQEVVSQFIGIARRMRSVGLSSQALSVLKQCSQRIRREESLYEEIQEYTVSTSEEVLQQAGTSTSAMTEADLQDMANSSSNLSATAIDKLVNLYMSQHRWKDATRTLKQALHGAWPSFFSRSPNDVAFPRSNVRYSIDLARRLRHCYRYRRNLAKEEDTCLRLYHAVQRDRKVGGDELFDGVSKGLVSLYERTRQTDRLISIHNDILKDYTKRYGDGHPSVLKELWTLAELTRPGAACVDYYQRIFEILNKNSDTCRPEAFEPLVILTTELVNQKRYKAALQPCSLLFKTLKHPNINSKLRDDKFVKSVYERYINCLHMTHAEFRVIHDVTAEYRKACLSVFGSKAVITIEATKIQAHIAQTSTEYESEAVELYEQLLQTESEEADIDYEDIRATLAGISEEQSSTGSKPEHTTSQTTSQTVTTYRKRLTTTLSSHGWAHESTLSQMEELVSLYAQQNDTQSAVVLLHDAASHILKSDSSSVEIIKAARSIAFGYREIRQIQHAWELAQEIHRQVITGESTSAKYSITSSKHQSLLFLAQLEYSLRDGRELSLTMNEIYSSLMAESVYSERFRTEARSKSTSLQGILPTVSHLEELFNLRGDSPSSQLLMERFTDFFMSREGEVLDLNRRQATVFLSTVLEHFRTHSSQNFLRSVALASHDRVVHLLSVNEHQAAADLALASFRYIQAHDGFATMTTMKLVFKMGLAISAWVVNPQAGSRFEQDMINISETICKEMLRHCKGKNIDLSQLDAVHLNNLIKVLDKQKDYRSLSWLLTSLWTKRQISSPPQANGGYTLALGRMLVVTRYLVGEYTSAIRLAEDIVYNCARVHGPAHPSTVEMSVLLSQMYTSVAQGYQNKEDQRELAYQYYKKAAGLHENSLRALVDPSSASIAGTDGFSSSSSSEPSSPGGESGTESSGKRAKKHLHLLKLAIERLGNWPKDYKEYEQLNSDLFTAFGNDLKGVEGVEKWNLKQFGSGRAEASDDLIALKSYPRLDLNSLAITV